MRTRSLRWQVKFADQKKAAAVKTLIYYQACVFNYALPEIPHTGHDAGSRAAFKYSLRRLRENEQEKSK